MYGSMVIGGGPAGLCASIYLARKQVSSLLISGDIGGQINWTLGIENYLGYQFIEGPELIDKFHAQIKQFPLDQQIGDKVARLDAVDGAFEATTEAGKKYRAETAILATGKKSRRLNVYGEVELTGRGVSYCAICDGPIFAGGKVAVVGGGNSAVEAALDMAKIASQVYLVSTTQLTADAILTAGLNKLGNLTQYLEYQVENITGEGLVEGIQIKGLKNGKTERLKVSGVFVEIGLTPNSDPVRHLVNLNKQGEVPVSCLNETTLPGLYAAGDVTDTPEKQIIIAAGEGAKAALQVHRYLQRKGE
jgi:alkyl hydroperoxide reductase subunit F